MNSMGALREYHCLNPDQLLPIVKKDQKEDFKEFLTAMFYQQFWMFGVDARCHKQELISLGYDYDRQPEAIYPTYRREYPDGKRVILWNAALYFGDKKGGVLVPRCDPFPRYLKQEPDRKTDVNSPALDELLQPYPIERDDFTGKNLRNKITSPRYQRIKDLTNGMVGWLASYEEEMQMVLSQKAEILHQQNSAISPLILYEELARHRVDSCGDQAVVGEREVWGIWKSLEEN